MPAVRRTRRGGTVKEEELDEQLALTSTEANFNQSVYDQVRLIPEGKIAKRMGFPKHSRMVGNALKTLPRQLASPHLPQSAIGSAEDEVLPEPEPNPEFVPWHRVVSSTGVISPRGSLSAVMRQADFLRAEGVEVLDGPRAGVGIAAAQRNGAGSTVDAFGLGGVDGGRVSMTAYRWDGELVEESS